jgi:hypothetical protein
MSKFQLRPVRLSIPLFIHFPAILIILQVKIQYSWGSRIQGVEGLESIQNPITTSYSRNFALCAMPSAHAAKE